MKKITRRQAIAATGAGLTIWPGVLHRAKAQTQEDEFRPKVVIRHSFPTISDAPVISAPEANRLLGESELVLGVTVGDASRAYPINMLTGPRREIINDKLGGRAIAATW